MDNFKIRLSHTDSVNSVDKKNLLGVQLQRTSKKLHYNDIKSTIDQYEQFKKEMGESTKYRVILTINPYCTNVLFNPLTEVWRVNNNVIDRYVTNTTTVNGIDGTGTPLRVQMVCNTEYSKESPMGNSDGNFGYSYMPGYDIFDNHILRNNKFKIVEPSIGAHDVFNTIADYYRDAGGNVIKFKKRTSLNKKPSNVNQHLYTSGELLTFEESVNANLTDENGWFGFINASSLKTTGPGDNGKASPISCVINNRKNCEFIDMYPDRSTFTFSPYYNSIVGRLENNWDVFLTYVYDRDYCNPLVANTKVKNALSVLSVTLEKGLTGEDIYVFRCFTKHNLKRGDMVKVFLDSSEPVGIYRVSNVGNTSNGSIEYYFYIDAADVNEGILNCADVRIRKFYNGMDSSYYVRKLKKIDGIKSERYKLAFASTIYDDDTTQITFTDDIDISELETNFDLPITELFVTIVKKNVGNELWYSDRNISPSDVEISHCYGDITVGFMLGHEKNDKSKNIVVGGSQISITQRLEDMRDARVINNNNHFKSCRKQIKVDVDSENYDWMLCDVVEFSPEDCKEHILSDCAYRFNTVQRERKFNDRPPKFIYHEIKFDDYDMPKGTDDQFVEIKGDNPNVIRDEGYYYKANYAIPIRDLGDINIAGHRDISVKDASSVYNGDIELCIKSARPTRLNTNDTIYVCDDINENMFEFICTEVKSPTIFLMSPKGEGRWESFKSETNYIKAGGVNWLELSLMLKSGSLKIRGKNYEIPSYAFKIGNNSYMWRNVLSPGQSSMSSIPEYTFTNGAFYLTPVIRFYLKRQDPDNSIGLQAKDVFPNDVFGNIQKESNYYYKDEPQDLC